MTNQNKKNEERTKIALKIENGAYQKLQTLKKKIHVSLEYLGSF